MYLSSSDMPLSRPLRAHTWGWSREFASAGLLRFNYEKMD